MNLSTVLRVLQNILDKIVPESKKSKFINNFQNS